MTDGAVTVFAAVVGCNVVVWLFVFMVMLAYRAIERITDGS